LERPAAALCLQPLLLAGCVHEGLQQPAVVWGLDVFETPGWMA